jgi:hypothetical protein
MNNCSVRPILFEDPRPDPAIKYKMRKCNGSGVDSDHRELFSYASGCIRTRKKRLVSVIIPRKVDSPAYCCCRALMRFGCCVVQLERYRTVRKRIAADFLILLVMPGLWRGMVWRGRGSALRALGRWTFNLRRLVGHRRADCDSTASLLASHVCELIQPGPAADIAKSVRNNSTVKASQT